MITARDNEVFVVFKESLYTNKYDNFVYACRGCFGHEVVGELALQKCTIMRKLIRGIHCSSYINVKSKW